MLLSQPVKVTHNVVQQFDDLFGRHAGRQLGEPDEIGEQDAGLIEPFGHRLAVLQQRGDLLWEDVQ